MGGQAIGGFCQIIRLLAQGQGDFLYLIAAAGQGLVQAFAALIQCGGQLSTKASRRGIRRIGDTIDLICRAVQAVGHARFQPLQGLGDSFFQQSPLFCQNFCQPGNAGLAAFGKAIHGSGLLVIGFFQPLTNAIHFILQIARDGRRAVARIIRRIGQRLNAAIQCIAGGNAALLRLRRGMIQLIGIALKQSTYFTNFRCRPFRGRHRV